MKKLLLIIFFAVICQAGMNSEYFEPFAHKTLPGTPELAKSAAAEPKELEPGPQDLSPEKENKAQHSGKVFALVFLAGAVALAMNIIRDVRRRRRMKRLEIAISQAIAANDKEKLRSLLLAETGMPPGTTTERLLEIYALTRK